VSLYGNLIRLRILDVLNLIRLSSGEEIKRGRRSRRPQHQRRNGSTNRNRAGPESETNTLYNNFWNLEGAFGVNQSNREYSYQHFASSSGLLKIRLYDIHCFSPSSSS
jgi:hypothetical protein